MSVQFPTVFQHQSEETLFLFGIIVECDKSYVKIRCISIIHNEILYQLFRETQTINCEGFEHILNIKHSKNDIYPKIGIRFAFKATINNEGKIIKIFNAEGLERFRYSSNIRQNQMIHNVCWLKKDEE